MVQPQKAPQQKTSQQKGPKQPQDPYAQRGKTLASSVKRLQGWAGSDPSRNAELADALLELTAHRLLGHGYAAGVADAQDAVRRAADALGAKGPIGPYTSVDDAVRYLTAVIQLAAVQVGLGLPDAAGRTMDAVQDLHKQLRTHQLDAKVEPQTAIWALAARARAALASGDAGGANAYADAALARLNESGLRDDPDVGYLPLDVDRLLSDCRWAGGRLDEALGYLHGAKDRYDEAAVVRLREPGRLSPALLERLADPLFGLYRDMADRLAAHGDVDLGLVTRRALVDLLRDLAGRLGGRAPVQLGLAWSDLADDLLRADRVEEADAATSEAWGLGLDGSAGLLIGASRARLLARTGRSAEAATLLKRILPEPTAPASAGRAVGLLALGEVLRADGDLEGSASAREAYATLAAELVGTELDADDQPAAVQDLARGVVARGRSAISWASVSTDDSYALATASTDGGDSDSAELETARQRETAAWLAAERAEAHRLEQEREVQARREAEQRETARLEAERLAAEKAAAEQTRIEAERKLEAERQAAAEQAEREERKRRREERLEEHRLEMERRAAEQAEADRALTPHSDEELDVDEEPAEREPVAPDVVEPEPVAFEPVEPEPAPEPEPEPETVAHEPEAVEPEAVEPEPVEPEPVEPEPELVGPEPEPDLVAPETIEPLDEVTVAEQDWRDAKSRGDRRAARAALERLVELLRPRAGVDLSAYGLRLQVALEELSSARFRSGDVWGSRAPAKEAKALAKTLSDSTP